MLEKNSIYNTIIDFLSHNLDDQKTSQFQEWLNELDENRNLFLKIEKQWNSIGSISPESVKGWDKLRLSIVERRKGFIRRNLFSVAAAATILLMIASGWFLSTSTSQMISLVTNQDTFIRDTLENGCIIYLYPSSSINIRLSISDEQIIKLSGEAFFIVPPNSGLNVKIVVGGADIKVTGTSFRVNEKDGKEVSVLVESGAVILKSQSGKNKQLIVQAGEQGYFTNNNNKLWKKPKTENIYLIYQPNSKSKEPC